MSIFRQLATFATSYVSAENFQQQFGAREVCCASQSPGTPTRYSALNLNYTMKRTHAESGLPTEYYIFGLHNFIKERFLMKSKLAVLPAILKRLELMPYLKALQNIFSYPKKQKTTVDRQHLQPYEIQDTVQLKLSGSNGLSEYWSFVFQDFIHSGFDVPKLPALLFEWFTDIWFTCSSSQTMPVFNLW